MIFVNGTKIDLDKRFPDGTFAFHVIRPLGSAVVRWYYQNEDELAALFFITRHLKQDPSLKISLLLPYCPNARFDRVHHKDEVFTLQHFADFINSLEFDSVSILDPHSNVTPALIHRCRVLSPGNFIRKAMRQIGDEDLILFYPDEGAMKRYSDVVKAPYGFGIKRRCWETGEITGMDVVLGGSIKGKKVLIIDDICCRGGTFFHSAKKLKEMGASKVFAYCSHCEKAIFEGSLLTTDYVDHIYTTDSVFQLSHPKITVLPIEAGQSAKEG